MGRKKHWENVFSTKTEKEVSWYQEYPQTSIDFITALELPIDAKIIDIGGGDSYLIDALLDLGYTNLTLLDISANAIERLKKRLGDKAIQVTFIESDILEFVPTEHYDFWHDRACFHFLTKSEDVEQYAEIAAKALAKTGRMFIGTFSNEGPKRCSGLDICHYDTKSLQSVFEKDFQLKGGFAENHKTPFGTTQNFLFCGFKRKEKSIKNILVLCTGNSCRSQMAHGYLAHFANSDNVKVYSAGVETHGVNPLAIAIMNEDGVDISKHSSNNVDEYFDIPFDYVITVCDNAKERCPFFPTNAVKLHHNFPDPSKVKGSTTEVIEEFRKVRAMIKEYCKDFITENQLD